MVGKVKELERINLAFRIALQKSEFCRKMIKKHGFDSVLEQSVNYWWN